MGTVLLAGLLDEALLSDRSVVLFVDSASPVRAWYERLGYTASGDHGIYTQMTYAASREGRRQ